MCVHVFAAADTTVLQLPLWLLEELHVAQLTFTF